MTAEYEEDENMTTFKIQYTKTRNAARVYVLEIEAMTKADAISEFYTRYPKYHIFGKVQ